MASRFRRMYFQDEAARNLEKTVLDRVENLLVAGLTSPDIAPTLAKWGTPRITRDPEVGLQWFIKEKRPFLFLQLDGDDQFGWNKVLANVLHDGTRHELTICVEAITNASCREAELPLKDALRRILETAYSTLRGNGLEGAKVRIAKPEEAPDRRNPHFISATAYTL